MSNTIPSTSQLVEKIPLIKSPSFWIPDPVKLPPDIHPLPEDITEYFVYPHTLESHCLTALPTALRALQAAHSQRLHLLASLAESKERARKATLNRLAPGWGEGGGIMEPVRRESVLIGSAGPSGVAVAPKGGAVDLLEEEDEEDALGLGLVGSAQKVERNVGDQVGGTMLGEDQLGSPKEMGAVTLDRLERDQMQALVDGLAAMDGERTRKAGLLF